LLVKYKINEALKTNYKVSFTKHLYFWKEGDIGGSKMS
jgi:hypothetical protein